MNTIFLETKRCMHHFKLSPDKSNVRHLGKQMKKVRIFITLVALLLSPNSHAVFVDGYELVVAMKAHVAADAGSSNYDPVMATSFRAYVSGYADALNGVSICPNKEQNYYILYWAVVTVYLQNNPKKWSEHPSIIVREALNESFPCK